jgi:hypothetical protein
MRRRKVPTINGKEVKLFINGVELKGVKVGEGGDSGARFKVDYTPSSETICKGGGGDAAIFDKDGNPL